MGNEKHWTVDVVIDEQDERTSAQARLHTEDTGALTGAGEARVHPADVNVPSIGDELAAARALSDLSDRLRAATANDIEAFTGKSAHLS